MMNKQTDNIKQNCKLLYEELVKTLIRIIPLDNLDTVLANYLIEMAKLDDQSKEEEDISKDLTVTLN